MEPRKTINSQGVLRVRPQPEVSIVHSAWPRVIHCSAAMIETGTQTDRKTKAIGRRMGKEMLPCAHLNLAVDVHMPRRGRREPVQQMGLAMLGFHWQTM